MVTLMHPVNAGLPSARRMHIHTRICAENYNGEGDTYTSTLFSRGEGKLIVPILCLLYLLFSIKLNGHNELKAGSIYENGSNLATPIIIIKTVIVKGTY